MKYYLAIDIGASSGRHIIGYRRGGKIFTREVYRFPNGVKQQDGHLVWDTEALLSHIKLGIDAALEKYPRIESFSIDTWGVDYVLMNGAEPILPCYAYRDGRTERIIEKVHAKVPFQTLYAHTGIQFQPFNTVYQLCADNESGRLDKATDFLMMPEYFIYRLTGVKTHEYTNATTGGLVGAYARAYDRELIDRLGLPQRLFGELSFPGTAAGEYKGIKAVLCATHDTGSAVEGMPLGRDCFFLSSGTWSLLGAAIDSPRTDEESLKCNFTNEGGVGFIRFLKNIMGLWIIQNLQKQTGYSFEAMADMARASKYEKTFDVNLPRFLSCPDMRAEVLGALGESSLADSDIFNSVYRSLAQSYADAVNELESVLGEKRPVLVIAGGGAKNGYLNELTCLFTGKEVRAYPVEATAIGNLKVQMEAAK
jgi:rhamnulokinase